MNKKIVIPIVLVIVIGASIGFYFTFLPLFFEILDDSDKKNGDDGDNGDDDYEMLDRIEFNISGTIIDDFAYWLQDMNTDTIKNSKYDLIIMDYSSDGNETGEYTKSQVIDMKSSGDKEKLLLSYISIGEAENYRFYWNDSWDANHDGKPDIGAPEWLNESNSEWPDNYKVKYWYKGWQAIIYEYLDRIINVNFSGIYMDIIDAYEFFKGKIAHSDWLMIDFVCNISDYVKNKAGENFSIFVQNADELLSNSTYLNHIDGIGREDLFYIDNDKTDDTWRNEGINNLNIALDENKTVLIVDYPSSTNKIYDFYKNSINNGYLAYAAERDLNNLKHYSFYPAT